jgi:L,D-peptidoglycan transpeptidase YkuD (ErfK/YbiS/YcfS/YnhG family)
MTRSRAEQEHRANLLVAGGIGALALLVVIALAVLALQPPHQPAEQPERPAEASAPATIAPVAASPATAAAPASPTATAAATPPPAPAPKPAPKPKPAPAPKTLPEEMRRLLPGSRQMIVITGSKLGSKSGTLALYTKTDGHWSKTLSSKAYFGANGLGDGLKRKEGNLQTPTGIWSIGEFVFGQHKSPPSGTRMPYRAITGRSWWSSKRDSSYNTWVSSSSHVSGEHLADAKVQYEWAFNTGYNSLPNDRVIGRGTAIFIHCSEPPGNSLGKNTHGCIAVPPSVMKQLFAQLDPELNPSCAIGTLKRGSATSIWAY